MNFFNERWEVGASGFSVKARDGSRFICMVTSQFTGGERQEIARLIAMAPMLLTALRDLRDPDLDFDDRMYAGKLADELLSDFLPADKSEVSK